MAQIIGAVIAALQIAIYRRALGFLHEPLLMRWRGQGVVLAGNHEEGLGNFFYCVRHIDPFGDGQSLFMGGGMAAPSEHVREPTTTPNVTEEFKRS